MSLNYYYAKIILIQCHIALRIVAITCYGISSASLTLALIIDLLVLVPVFELQYPHQQSQAC